MIAKRIIPCLDVKNDLVVKGINFKNHQVVGEILYLAKHYCEQGADELIFYDITASCNNRSIDYQWITKIAALINIPFCVAGCIRSVQQAEQILRNGADKISINSPALERPEFISHLVQEFGSQCVVIGIDSRLIDGDYEVFQYTGDERCARQAGRKTKDWLREVIDCGAGEIVLNCMDVDGMKNGYDLEQLCMLQEHATLPIIASGGAGSPQHFIELFTKTNVSGALAASIFHEGQVRLPALKQSLLSNAIEVRCD